MLVRVLMVSILLIQLMLEETSGQISEWSRELIAQQAAEQESSVSANWEEFELELRSKSAININTVDEEVLTSWGVLTPWQVQQFLTYRMLFGNFIHVNELQAVPGWDPSLIKRLLPFVVVKERNEFSETQKKVKMQFSMRSSGLPFFSSAEALSPGNSLGDRHRLMLQLRMEYAGWNWGVTAKKDPGEPLWRKGIQQGFDFYGIHAYWQGRGLIKMVALGDYTLNMGQGLIHWQTMALRKTGEFSMIKRQAPFIKPHRSSGEFNFHRGAAIQLKKNRWEFSAFFSRRRLSANLLYDSSGIPLSVRSINTSGYHRTFAEINAKNKLTEWLMGVRLAQQQRSINWGINAISYHYSVPLERGIAPYQLYNINGRNWQNASFDFSFTKRNAHFFGELAIDKQLNNAFTAGILLSADPRMDFSVIIRALSKGYQSLYSTAFTESTKPSNELGVYLGICLRPSDRVQINIYNDFYQFPWLRYRLSMPYGGREHFIQATYQPNKSAMLTIQLRQEQKPEDPAASSSENPLPLVNAPIKSSARVHVEKKINRQLAIRFRTEMLWLKNLSPFSGHWTRPAVENGFMSYFETGYHLPHLGARFTLRAQYYDTESYKSRIYSFLPDPGSPFSVTASYGRGILVGAFISKRLINNFLSNISFLLKDEQASGKWRPALSLRLSWNP